MDTTYSTATFADILTALGDQWTDQHEFLRPTNGVRFQHADGYGLYLRIKYQRVEISGTWPMTRDKQTQAPRHPPLISVSATRPPAEIAREIIRRFLPEYLGLYAAQVEAVYKLEAYTDQTEATKVALERLQGVRRSNHGGDTLYTTGYHPYTLSVTGDRVTFERFTVPLEVALSILPQLEKADDS